jgi:D-Tyr-tRNAtyr deacylase
MVTKGTNRRGRGLVLSSKLLQIMKIDLCNSGPITIMLEKFNKD